MKFKTCHAIRYSKFTDTSWYKIYACSYLTLYKTTSKTSQIWYFLSWTHDFLYFLAANKASFWIIQKTILEYFKKTQISFWWWSNSIDNFGLLSILALQRKDIFQTRFNDDALFIKKKSIYLVWHFFICRMK